jgi:hypothetical protein
MQRAAKIRKTNVRGAAIIAASVAVLIVMAALPVGFWVTDSNPEFVSEEMTFLWNNPESRPEHARNLRQWFAWRLGVRSEPPTAYIFHELIKLITETDGRAGGK